MASPAASHPSLLSLLRPERFYLLGRLWLLSIKVLCVFFLFFNFFLVPLKHILIGKPRKVTSKVQIMGTLQTEVWGRGGISGLTLN